MARRVLPVGIGAAGALVLVLGGLGVAAVSLGLAAAPAGAAGSTFTWSGTSPTTAAWSLGSNWQGGTAPSATVGALSFPAGVCPSGCVTEQDLALSAGAVGFGGSYSVEAMSPSDTLGIGAGGLAVSGSAPVVGLATPVTLTAGQTWTVGGSAANLGLLDPLSGAHGLTVKLGGGATLALLGGDDEVGPVSVVGADAADSGASSAGDSLVVLGPSLTTGQPGALDATDGNAVTVTAAVLQGNGTVGPLDLSGATLQAGLPGAGSGTLAVAGSLSLDGTSVLGVGISGTGTTPGTDYGQVTASGAVDLGGAVLEPAVTASGCSVPSAGSVYTILVAGGGLTGHLDSAPGVALADGGTVPIAAGTGCAQTGEVLKVAYDATASPASVTGTVETAAASPSGPAASTTTLAASAASVPTGAGVTFTATVTPAPTGGTVAFSAGGSPLAGCSSQPVVSSGAGAGLATCATSFAKAGTEQVTAAYSGDAAEAGSTSTALAVTVTATGTPPGGGNASGGGKGTGTGSGAPPAPAAGAGYLQATRDGWVFAFGAARYFGSLPSDGVRVGDIVSVVATPDGRGYWLVGADGGVYAFGDAGYYGSVPGAGVRVSDVVGMAATPDGRGYWLAAAHGGVYAFGDARYVGSLPGMGVSVPDIVATAR